MQKVTHNKEETQAFAYDLARTLHGGMTVLLVGDIGAGKTTFVQGLAKVLGVTARVTSPTFTIMQEYPAEHGDIRRVVHIDLYRFTDAEELRALALEDERRPNTLVVIEWPDAIAYDFAPDIVVRLDHAGGDERRITVEGAGAQSLQ